MSLHLRRTMDADITADVDYVAGVDGCPGYYVLGIDTDAGDISLFLTPGQFVVLRAQLLDTLSDADEAATMREPIQRAGAQEDDDDGALDEAVHDAKGAEAADINNAGPAAQRAYLEGA